jgi:hypothetical protein
MNGPVWEWIGKVFTGAGLVVGLAVGIPALIETLRTEPSEILIVEGQQAVALRAGMSDDEVADTIIADRVTVEGSVVLNRSRLAIVANSIRFAEDAQLLVHGADGAGGAVDIVAPQIVRGIIDVSGLPPGGDLRDGHPGGQLRVIAGLVEGTAFAANGSDGRNGRQGPRGANGRNGRCDGFGRYRGARSGEDGGPGENGGDGGAAGRVVIVTAGIAPRVSAEAGQGGAGGTGGEGGRGGDGCVGLGGSQPSRANGARGAPGDAGSDGASVQPQVAAQAAFGSAADLTRELVADGVLSEADMTTILERTNVSEEEASR